MFGVAIEGADEANVLETIPSLTTCKKGEMDTYTLTVIKIQIPVTIHLYFTLQFCGFSGSSGPSQPTRFVSVVASAATSLASLSNPCSLIAVPSSL